MGARSYPEGGGENEPGEEVVSPKRPKWSVQIPFYAFFYYNFNMVCLTFGSRGSRSLPKDFRGSDPDPLHPTMNSLASGARLPTKCVLILFKHF